MEVVRNWSYNFNTSYPFWLKTLFTHFCLLSMTVVFGQLKIYKSDDFYHTAGL